MDAHAAGMPDDINACANAAAAYGHLLNVLCDMEYLISRHTNGQGLKTNPFPTCSRTRFYVTLIAAVIRAAKE